MQCGRTQEILYELNKIKENTDDEQFINKYRVLMETPVYVDSPLAISATEIFKNNEELFDDDVKKEIESGDDPLEFNRTKIHKNSRRIKSIKRTRRTKHNHLSKWNV